MPDARAAVFEGPQVLRVHAFPLPDPLPAGALLVDVDLAGVDGSEVHILRGELENLNRIAPFVMGDELIGRVSALGAGAAQARGLALGDRVVVEARWPCNECRACIAGEYYVCEKGKIGRGYGVTTSAEPPYLWGTYATHLYVPAEAKVYRVPDALPDRAALIGGSVLANAVRWTEKAGIGLGDRVAVVGPGPQGIACGLVATMRGAEVSVLGLPRDRARLDLAEHLRAGRTAEVGAEETALEQAIALRTALGVDRFDVVMEAAGTQRAKDLAVELVGVGGTLANCSLTDPHRLEVDFYTLLLKSVTMISVASHPHTVDRSLTLAADLYSRGVDLGDMISHVFPLDDVELALRTAAYETDERPVKVVLEITR